MGIGHAHEEDGIRARVGDGMIIVAIFGAKALLALWSIPALF